MSAVLQLADVTKSFGGIKAVTGVSFLVPEGSIFGLIGPNGAGKTTVFNLVTGVYRADSGAIRFDARDITAKKPAQIAAAGIARTFQNIRLFSQMSVLDNVLVACETTRQTGLRSALARSSKFRAEENQMRDKALELLEIFELRRQAEERSTSLSYGSQRRLEIARAMMLGPKLLLLDEPAAGLNRVEAEGLQKQIRWLRERFNLTVLLVEHNMRVVMSVCEEIHVLDYGQTIAQGKPHEIRQHPKVLAAYLGEST